MFDGVDSASGEDRGASLWRSYRSSTHSAGEVFVVSGKFFEGLI